MQPVKASALVFHPDCRNHDTGLGHPERPERFDAVVRVLDKDQPSISRLTPRLATMEDLCLVHAKDYLERAKKEILAGHDVLSTGDTQVSEASWQAALAGAGCALTAADAIMAGEFRTAFCAVRPPGHHATPTKGMGFCVANNVAIAARHLQRRHGIRRVLIVDWDVHHGNGTQDAFYTDGSVFFFSTHQSPWYPGTGSARETGEGDGAGTTLNCPLPAGSGGREIGSAFESKLVPAMSSFQPEFVLISAGFDSRAGDPLGQFRLTDADFVSLTKIVRGIADQYAGGRVLSLLEGGYSLEGLAAGVSAHVGGLSAA